LGNGVYGFAFSLEDQELANRNINVVAKISNSTKRQNILETGYGLAITKIVERGDSPNLPLFAYCKGARNKENCICTQNCDFQNPINGVAASDNDKLQNIMKNKCYVSFAEKLDGDANHFFRNMFQQRETEETFAKHLFSCMVQLMFGLKELDKYGLAHTDMHASNILVKQRICNDPDATPFLNYTYEGHTFSVAHMDTLCVIWDFGFISKKGKNLDQLGFTESFMSRIFNGENKNWEGWQTSVLYDIARFMAHIMEIITRDMDQYPLVYEFCYNTFFALTTLLKIGYEEKTNDPIFYVKRLFPSMISNDRMEQWWGEVVRIDDPINPVQILASYPAHMSRDNQIMQSIDRLEDEGDAQDVQWNDRLQQQAANSRSRQVQQPLPALRNLPNAYVQAQRRPLVLPNLPSLPNAYVRAQRQQTNSYANPSTFFGKKRSKRTKRTKKA
jgi:hypothetical protein